MTGEVLAEAGTKITRELASTIQNNAVPYEMCIRDSAYTHHQLVWNEFS